MTAREYPRTPDGRYFVVKGRLWRLSNPALSEAQRDALVRTLMSHRAAVARAQRKADADALKAARRGVHQAKVALGERGPVWWDDGAPDLNRRLVRNTPYRDWFAALPD